MRRLFRAAALAAACSVLLSAAPARPRLVVLIVVDQMRADYIDRFHDDWSSGLRRLVDDGAHFTNAAYPYLTTFTCVGHATVATGAYPHTHGIINNTWWDRAHQALVPCTDDAAAQAISYGHPLQDHTGPANLRVPTLADQMRTQGAHVVSLSLKGRSAIMMAGHGGDAVTWVSESLDTWETSTAFAKAPVPEVKTFVDANPLDADYGKVWNRRLDASRYKDPDDGLAEDPPPGWTNTFPHVLKTESGKPDTKYHDAWEDTPFANEYLARMAASFVDTLRLGRHDGTDFLGVSFSGTDIAGHDFGPRSQEVQDLYANLDASIGELLSRLDASVGAGNYVVALSADHGVAEIPEQAVKEGRDAGRVSASGLLNAGESRARALLGQGTYLSRVNYTDVYFAPGMWDRVKANRQVLDEIVGAMSKQPGIARVFTSDQVSKGLTSNDRLLRAAALSYVPGRTGDLVVVPKPGWVMTTVGTTHGSPYDYDQHVPLLLFGARIKSGLYAAPVSPADIAPTLASIVGVRLPKAEGRPLKEALR